MLARIIFGSVLLLLGLCARSVEGGPQDVAVSLTLTDHSPNDPISVGDMLTLKCRVFGARSAVKVWWKRKRVAESPPEMIQPEVHRTSDTASPSAKYTQTTDIDNTIDQKFILRIFDLKYGDDGIYFCLATIIGDNKTFSDSWTLVVQGEPEIVPMNTTKTGIVGYNEIITIEYIARPLVTSAEWSGPTGQNLSVSSTKFRVEEDLDSVHGHVVLNIANFSREDRGNYTLVLRNALGPKGVVVELNADPFVHLVSPNASTTFPYGTTAVFICRAANFHYTPTFSWHHGVSGINLSTLTASSSVSISVNQSHMGMSQSTVTIRGITYDFIGELVCEASEWGETYTDRNVIDVIGSPVIHSTMRTVRGGIGETVKLGCSVTSNPPPSQLKWLFNKDILGFQEYAIEGLKRETSLEMSHVVEVTSSADYGSYMCQVTNKYGTIGYSINVVGPLTLSPTWNCSESRCPYYKVCDHKVGKCVCTQGHTENRDGTCTVSKVTYEAKPAQEYVWVGIGAGSIFVVTIIMAVILYLFWKKRSSLIKKKAKNEDLGMVNAAYTHAQYATANIYEIITRPSDEFPRERLRFYHPLGIGKFGRVMKAEALSINRTGSWEEVAVKMCQESATDLDKEDLYNELVIIRKIPKHINVVSFYGACTYGEPLLLILEYVPGGDLRNYLRRKRPDTDRTWESPCSEGESPLGTEIRNSEIDEGELTAKDLLSFALQSAKGMQHLEANDIVHRDVAARNILIGYNGVCKVSDFGLARNVEGVDVYERTSKGPLPVRWMSPEALMEGSHSHKADVWAFGILLWEIVTLGASPYSTLTLRSVIDAVIAGKRLERPQHCMDELYSLMCRCWEHFPKDRPGFSDLSQHLEYLLEKEADYIQLDQFQEAVYMVLEPDSTEEKL